MTWRRVGATCALALACLVGGTTPSLGDPLAAPGARDGERAPRHSSDGVVGAIAPAVPPYFRGVSRRTEMLTWQAAPGVTVSRWDERDSRGPIRAQLLTVDLDEPGVSLDYAGAGRVASTAKMTDILARDGAIAGVNGDFFDIGQTGAPLGVGRDRVSGLLHAPKFGWNSSFSVDREGRPDIGSIPMKATLAQHPGFKITNINSPRVKAGGIGVYTSSWGKTVGYRITSGQKRNVRMVLVRGGRVVSTRATLDSGSRIDGTLLIGRGRGAADLSRLRKGQRATVDWQLVGRPAMAITGDRFLVRDGLVEVVDDREMHPRTAIGIDYDTNDVLILVVDGRQSFSRGYTMVELAEAMIELGCDEALNLDGGGSSTMVAKKPNGKVGVVNSPSDGGQRLVPNGVAVLYAAP